MPLFKSSVKLSTESEAGPMVQMSLVSDVSATFGDGCKTRPKSVHDEDKFE
jgi:hypothetical protein